MTEVTTNNKTSQCDTLGILAIIFGILARIPIIGRAFLAAAIALGIISVAQNGKKAVCGIIGIVLSGLVIISKIVMLAGLFSLGSKGINMMINEVPNLVSEENLPQAIEYIEEYKDTYGDYPEFLADLQEISDEAFESTIDPMGIKGIISTALKGEEITEEEALELIPQYYYEKLDDGYYLFSQGSDQKPFTKDDIVPDMTKLSGDLGLKLP